MVIDTTPPVLSEKAYDHRKDLRRRRWRRLWEECQLWMGLDPRLPFEQRKIVVVLGTGWGAMNFVRHLNICQYNITIVSPRSFFTITPLLPAVCSGTLSPRACLVPVRPKILRGGRRVMQFHEGKAIDLDYLKKEVYCQGIQGDQFTLSYDYLVLAVGSEPNTLGIPGALKYALFLKDIDSACEIRRRILRNFERACCPGVTDEVQSCLLHCVVVGGGPSGVELAAELSDFLRGDAHRQYPELYRFARVTLVEMESRVLPRSSPAVSKFARACLQNHGVNVLLEHRVTQFSSESISLVDKDQVLHILRCEVKVCVLGTCQVPFTKRVLQAVSAQSDNGVLHVDETLCVHGTQQSIYALGDCAVVVPEPLTNGPGTQWLKSQAELLTTRFPQLYPLPETLMSEAPLDQLDFHRFKTMLESIDASYKPPPPTVQTAAQEGRYLASMFNRYVTPQEKAAAPAYIHQWNGSIAYVGQEKSVMELPTHIHKCNFFTKRVRKNLIKLRKLQRPTT